MAITDWGADVDEGSERSNQISFRFTDVFKYTADAWVCGVAFSLATRGDAGAVARESILVDSSLFNKQTLSHGSIERLYQ